MKTNEPVLMKARRSARDVGGCNFCSRQHTRVWEVESRDPHCRLVVRFCDKCANEFSKGLRR